MATAVLRSVCHTKHALWRSSRSWNAFIVYWRNFSISPVILNGNYSDSVPQRKSRVGFDDYENEVANFSFHPPEKFNFASDVIDAWALKEKSGERKTYPPAFWYVRESGEEIKWSFQELSEESKRTANALELYCGLNRGDHVIVILPKIPEFWLVNLAAIRTGTILSSATMMLTAKDIAYRFKTFRPICIIADESIAATVDQAASSCSTLKTKVLVSSQRNRRPGWLDFHSLHESVSSDHKCAETRFDENMMVFFTSGTTGMPKMVIHTHGSYGFCLGITGKYWLDLTQNNIIWNLSDTGWAKTAYSNIFAPWSRGAGVFVHQMTRFSPSLVIEVLSNYPIDTMCAPPTAYKMLIQEKLEDAKFKKLEHCLSAGEALNPEVIKKWISLTGVRIYEGYGQTETVLLVGMYKCIEYVTGSIGKPCPGFTIAVVNDHGNELGPGQEGIIAAKAKPEYPPGLFKGYMDDPERSSARFVEDYFLTGDVGFQDEHGYFWFVGRSDDVILSAGYRIGPFEVESALMEHPAVVEVAVTSSPDDVRGEVVKAFVVLKNDYVVHDKDKLIMELQNHVKTATAPYKYPRKIEFVKDLPKTVSGKIRRIELKNKEWGKS